MTIEETVETQCSQPKPSWQPLVLNLCLQQPRQLGAATWEPCDSESEILRWVKNRALVARRGWEEKSNGSTVVGRPWGLRGTGQEGGVEECARLKPELRG